MKTLLKIVPFLMLAFVLLAAMFFLSTTQPATASPPSGLELNLTAINLAPSMIGTLNPASLVTLAVPAPTETLISVVSGPVPGSDTGGYPLLLPLFGLGIMMAQKRKDYGTKRRHPGRHFTAGTAGHTGPAGPGTS